MEFSHEIYVLAFCHPALPGCTSASVGIKNNLKECAINPPNTCLPDLK